jgi:hypothetical protein
MIVNSYIFCGLLYCFYVFAKIFENKENFLIIFKDQFGEEANLNLFLGIMFLTNLLAWPIMMVNEINNKKDF